MDFITATEGDVDKQQRLLRLLAGHCNENVSETVSGHGYIWNLYTGGIVCVVMNDRFVCCV